MCVQEHTLLSGEKEATPTAESSPASEDPGAPNPDFRSERQGGHGGVQSAPHLARQGGGGGTPLQPSLPWAETPLWELQGTLGDADGGTSSRVRLSDAGSLLNSAEGTRDSRSPRWVRAQDRFVSDVLCGVVPPLSRSVSGLSAWLETLHARVGGRGRNAHGRLRGSVSVEGGRLCEHWQIGAHRVCGEVSVHTRVGGHRARAEDAPRREWEVQEHARAQGSRRGRSVHGRGPAFEPGEGRAARCGQVVVLLGMGGVCDAPVQA